MNISETGFEIIEIVELPELKAKGIWAKHKKCGAEVFHVLNDDSENLFAFAFPTIPEDNTGAAHILEHSVLCGSENYPLKDSFIILAQGSLQTFLNAWTFPDKTVYPASSVNEQDYFNLMSVYGDAVFHPLLTEWTFMQEGCRYEYSKDDGKLTYNGVVYNEMKGVYSSLDAYAHLWSVKSVLQDTPYSLESGGDPDHIPELNWEGLKNFHQSRYSPSNCRIFLAGNIPTEKQLSFLSKKFFSLPKNESAFIPIPHQPRWKEPKEFRIPCPASGESKPTAFLSWLCTDALSIKENIALSVLTEILLGHDGSPLTKALVESGLGEDISPVTGLETELGETVFAVGLREIKEREGAKQTQALILNTLKNLVTNGIPKEEIDAALLFMEFSQKEVKRSGGPFSLVWMRRSLKAWMHGGNPWESLLLMPYMDEIRCSYTQDSRYFESLIQKYLLDNLHRALVIIEPKKNFLTEKQADLAVFLENKGKGMSETERSDIEEKSAALEKIQSEENTPEALAVIPHLKRSDLAKEPEIIPRRHEDLKGIPALCHDLYTNGISYIDLAFPVDLLPPNDYIWLPFFSRAIVSTGLPGMDYAEVSSLMAQTVGGFVSVLHTSSATPSAKFNLAGRDWIIYRIKCLDEKTAPSLDIALRLICEADFTDLRRLKDLVLEMKNEIRSGFSYMGSSYASCRASRSASHSTNTGETWNGLSHLVFAHNLAEMDIKQISEKLKYLRDTISAGGLIVNIAGENAALKKAAELTGQTFSRFGPPKRREAAFLVNDNGKKPEVFASPSLQIGFAAMTLKAATFDTKEQAEETVLAHYLSTGALWENIRMKGGAYGANAANDSLERCFTLSTYRDPSPIRSLEAFSSILKSGIGNLSEEELEKTIIGTYARETHPRSPSEKSINDFLRFLVCIDDESRKRKLERLVEITLKDISAVQDNLASQTAFGKVIITGQKDAEQIAASLGTDVQALPV